MDVQVGSKGPVDMGKSMWTSEKSAGLPIGTVPTGCGDGTVGIGAGSGRTGSSTPARETVDPQIIKLTIITLYTYDFVFILAVFLYLTPHYFS
jgi:hypothetical protein